MNYLLLTVLCNVALVVLEAVTHLLSHRVESDEQSKVHHHRVSDAITMLKQAQAKRRSKK
jgi:hypothetical protein